MAGTLMGIVRWPLRRYLGWCVAMAGSIAMACCACCPPPSGAVPSTYNVGFTICDFSYSDGGAEEVVLTTAIWYPTEEEPATYTYNNGYTSSVAWEALPCTEDGPYPLVVFNHGAYASGISALPFAERLAGEGFIVAAPDYIDTVPPDFIEQVAFNRTRGSEGVTDAGDVLEAVAQFADMMEEHRDIFLAYMEEVRLSKCRFVLDQVVALEQDSASPLYGIVDEESIGMAGHSLGGLTTLGLIGGHPDEAMRDERIEAALLLSSPVYPFEDGAGDIDIPLMVMHGDHDLPLIRPDIQRGVVYEGACPPKFYLVLAQSGHLTFGNAPCLGYDYIPQCTASDKRVGAIADYSAAFFLRYLKGDVEAELQLQAQSDALATYEWELP